MVSISFFNVIILYFFMLVKGKIHLDLHKNTIPVTVHSCRIKLWRMPVIIRNDTKLLQKL